MLISKLERGSENSFKDSTSSRNESGQICENVFKHPNLQWRLDNCLNTDSGSHSWSFSGRKPHSGISFLSLLEKNEKLLNTTQRSNHTRQRRDPNAFYLNENLATEDFQRSYLQEKLRSHLQIFCKPVIIRSCQKILPKYLSTSSQVRSH